jgi:hypothetical protein
MVLHDFLDFEYLLILVNESIYSYKIVKHQIMNEYFLFENCEG